VGLTVAAIVVFALLVVGLNYAANKFVFKGNREKKRSAKTGLKILFVSAQILAALPRIVPAIQLPENYSEALDSMQAVNLNVFELVNVGCFTKGFNVYLMALATTAAPLVVFVVLVLLKRTDAAIAVTFLVLPTVTTNLFTMFPCDKLDNGASYLHADYALSCDSSSRGAWVAYGGLMLLVYPVGVTGLYAVLLGKSRERLKTKDRDDDQSLAHMRFLFDAYKPKYWFFEIIETVRRLGMTGVLSAISPGSYVQLASGICMAAVSMVCFALCEPYVEGKDNALAILTNAQIGLVLLTALVLKGNGEKGGNAEEGVGALLLALNAMCVVLFVAGAVLQMRIYRDDTVQGKRGEVGTAVAVLKGGGKRKSMETGKEKEDDKFDADDSVEIEMGSIHSGDGGEDGFGYENPMRSKAGSVGGKKEKMPGNRGSGNWEELHDEEGNVYYHNMKTGETQWTKPM
jgi:hypothetical protein